MADRTVRVTLAVYTSNFLSGMQAAQRATRETETAVQRLANQRDAMEKVGKTLTGIGIVAAAGVALAVKSFADFDAQMSQVKTLSHATAGQMDELRNAALTMGQSIGFSATQAAEAQTELVKAGVSVKDILGGGLKGSLDLAAAGQLDVADATSIAATALTQFKLNGSDVPHVADLLAAGADKALGSVQDLGQGLKYVGPVAASMGISIESTVGTLAELAQNGILADQAGTSLRGMLSSLTSPSVLAADTMKKYGIEVYDASGKFVGFNGVAEQLSSHLGTLDDATRQQALGQIFGNEQITAATVLMDGGAKAVDKWTAAVDDNGFAAEQAAGKMDNLKGDISKLKASLESGLIRTGENANGALRDMVQSATGLSTAFSEAPAGIQSTALVLGVVTAAAALAGGGFLLMVPKIAAARAAMSTLNLTGARLSKGFAIGSGVLLGIAAVTNGISNMGTTATLASDQVSKLNSTAKLGSIGDLNKLFSGGGGIFDAVSKDSGGVKDALDSLTSTYGKNNIAAAKFADGFLFGLPKMSDTAKRFEAQFAQLGTTLGSVAQSDFPAATDSFNKLVKASGGGKDATQKLLDVMPEYKAALTDIASNAGETLSKQELLNFAQGKGSLAAKLAADSAKEQADGLAQLSGTATTAEGDISDLADAIANFGKTQFDVNSTARDFQAAIDDATSALKTNGRTTDVTTEKGRANQAALDAVASSAIASAGALSQTTNGQKKASKALEAGREAYINASVAAGISREAAKRYADQLGLTPKNITTAVGLTGIAAATQSLFAFKSNLDAITRARTVSITAVLKQNTTGLPVDGSYKLPGKADGGALTGPGPKGKDSILMYGAPGEHMLTTDDVDKLGGQGGVYRFRAALQAGSIPAFARGGAIRAAQAELDRDITAQKSAQRSFQDAKGAEKNRLRARVRDLQDQVTADRKALAAAKALPTGADASDRIDFRSTVRSGSFTAQTGVSDLYSMARENDKYTAKQRASFSAQANRSEVRMLKLEKASTKAAAAVDKASDRLDKLKDVASNLRDESASMASSTAGAVSKFDVGNFRSASSLKSGLSRSVGSAKEFAALLVKLRDKGIAPAMLSEIASLGTAEGLPLARSLAKASGGDIRSINASYKQLGTIGAAAGKTVADANFATLIKRADAQVAAAKRALTAADKNADKITKAINTQAGYLRKIVGKALGAPGYAGGGYTGPGSKYEPRGLVHAGEWVSTAETTADPGNRAALEFMHRGGRIQSYANGGMVAGQVRYMSSPQFNPDALVKALAASGMGKQFTYAPTVPVSTHIDPQTALTILGRELERGMAGMME